MGGLWEAGVRTAKHLLLRAVGSALLNAEEVATVLVGIEATMNLRPLGALSQDPSDGEALTPGHLLTGGPLIAAPALRTPDQAGLSCLRRWRLVSSVRQTFWRRWSREYVLGLQVRGKWHKEKANVEEGQLVVVAEDNLLPQQWLLGRIVATHAGEDGKVRASTLGGVMEPSSGGRSTSWRRCRFVEAVETFNGAGVGGKYEFGYCLLLDCEGEKI
ncbi:uncharacterized protein LOC120321532 [Drosophila yakuba]|uniref:uncharacterized protein LOC120321532 n=1 Tax=Drosophila yakuba TaxID=7245 RepID=UPI0019307F4E|nr:uncharacterized protein LOC120321532 [Drosophila yakuba]